MNKNQKFEEKHKHPCAICGTLCSRRAERCIKCIQIYKKTEEWKTKNSSLFRDGHKFVGNLDNPHHFKKGQRPSPETEFKKGEMSKEKHPNWKGGISFEEYSFDFDEELKLLIRTRDNHRCRLCGRPGNVVHHIDYNKKNSNPDNLITLCGKCHPRTNWNREFWIEYFRGG